MERERGIEQRREYRRVGGVKRLRDPRKERGGVDAKTKQKMIHSRPSLYTPFLM